MIDGISEESYNVRLIRYLLFCGSPLRAVDFYNEVGVSAGVSRNANIKALKRLVKWNVFSFINERYYFTERFMKDVSFIASELSMKRVAIVR